MSDVTQILGQIEDGQAAEKLLPKHSPSPNREEGGRC